MKQLSIEEKAKAYDEAIERAKKWYNAPNIDKMPTYGSRIIEEIFPELKESEDERIRKEIIAFLTYYHTGQGNSAKYDDSWIAWLEKQGEQNPTDSAETCKDEQNIVVPKFRVGDVIRPKGSTTEYTIESISGGCYRGDLWRLPIGCDADYELVEQKPAWSEEDEARFESCIKVLQTSDGYDTINVKWLKSLKDRFMSQPKQEWSEEDRRMLIGLIDELDAIMNKATPNEISVYSKYTNWLKSLRPQNRWKPSEFEIASFGMIIDHPDRMTDYNKKNLQSLYEQLKAL